MKLKTITTFLMLMFASMLFANEVNTMVAVSADGSETSYALSSIERINLISTDTETSMTVISKEGRSQSGYIRLLFTAEKTTFIEGVGEVAVYVYPNPVINTLNVQGVDVSTLLSVYNLSGKCMLQDVGTEIDVTSLDEGTYILQINNNYVKFIKK